MKRPLLTAYVASLTVLGALVGSPTVASAAGVDIGFVAAANPRIDGTPPDAEPRILKLGMSIFQNETISTSQIGSGQFIFLDQTTLTVSPGSELVLDRYVFDATRGTGEIVLTLSKGVLRFIGGRITKSGVGVVNTPHATIGIRGGIAAITVGEVDCGSQRCIKTKAVFLAGESMTVTGKTKTVVVTRAGGMVTVQGPVSESSEAADSDSAATESENSESADSEAETTEAETTEAETTEAETTEPIATEPIATEPIATEVETTDLGDSGEPVFVGVATSEDIGLIFESTDTGGDGGTTQTIDPVIVEASITDSGLDDIGATSDGAVDEQPVSTEGEEVPPEETQEETTDTTEDTRTEPETTVIAEPVEDIVEGPILNDLLPLATPIIPAAWSPSVSITHAFTGGYAAGLGQSTIPGPNPDPYVMRSPDGNGVIMGFDTAGNAVFAEFGSLDTFGSADVFDITLNFGDGVTSDPLVDDNVFQINEPEFETGALTGQAQSISGAFGTDPIGEIQTAMVGTLSSSGFEGDRGIFPVGTDTTPEFLRWGWWSADYQFDDTGDSPGGVAPRNETISGSWVTGVRSEISALGTSGEAQFDGLATAHVTETGGVSFVDGGRYVMTFDFGTRAGAATITGIAGTTFVSSVSEAGALAGNHFGGALIDLGPKLDEFNIVGSIDGSFFTGGGDPAAATAGAFDFTRELSPSVTQTGTGIFAADKVTD